MRADGEVGRRKNKGKLVFILDVRKGGDWAGCEEDGRWITVCDAHGGIIQHVRRRDADYWASHADEWCPGCQMG